MSSGPRLVPLTGGTQDRTLITAWEPPQSWTVGGGNLLAKGHPFHMQKKALCAQKCYLSSFCDSPLNLGISWESASQLLLLTAYVLAKQREKKHFPHPGLCKRTFCDVELFFICGAQYGND